MMRSELAYTVGWAACAGAKSSGGALCAGLRDQLGRGDRGARVGFDRAAPVRLARRELLAYPIGVAY